MAKNQSEKSEKRIHSKSMEHPLLRIYQQWRL